MTEISFYIGDKPQNIRGKLSLSIVLPVIVSFLFALVLKSSSQKNGISSCAPINLLLHFQEQQHLWEWKLQLSKDKSFNFQLFPIPTCLFIFCCTSHKSSQKASVNYQSEPTAVLFHPIFQHFIIPSLLYKMLVNGNSYSHTSIENPFGYLHSMLFHRFLLHFAQMIGWKASVNSPIKACNFPFLPHHLLSSCRQNISFSSPGLVKKVQKLLAFSQCILSLKFCS